MPSEVMQFFLWSSLGYAISLNGAGVDLASLPG